MKLLQTSIIVALLCGSTLAVKKVSDESRKIINSAVNDVLEVTGTTEPPRHVTHEVHHTSEVHHHAFPVPVPVVQHVHHVHNV